MLLRHLAISLFVLNCIVPRALKAQDTDTSMISEFDEMSAKKPNKFYWSNGMEGGIFQTSLLTRPGKTNALSTLRFTYFLNFGVNINYDYDGHMGLYSGIAIKNIGFIDKIKDSTIKHRVYALGIPLGIRIGDLQKRKFIHFGGGIDFALNYREKGFIKRNNKEKTSEWFSGRTRLLMPYVFAGMSFDPGITFKLQYYPGNFMNPSYSFNNGITTYYPYAGYNVHLLLLTLGFDIHFSAISKTAKEKKGVLKRIM
jgi:hypothetical protein